MLETEIQKLTAAIVALTAKLESGAAVAPATGQPAQSDALETPATAKQESVNLDDLTRLCLKLSRDGHRVAIKDKLADFGAGRIGELSDDNLVAFSEWANKL